MEAYRREVEKMKQLQEGKEKNKKEVEKKKTLDLVASKKKKNHGSHHHFPLFLSLCVSLSSFLLSTFALSLAPARALRKYREPQAKQTLSPLSLPEKAKQKADR